MIKKIIKNIGHSLHGIEIVNFVDIKLLYMFGTKDSFFFNNRVFAFDLIFRK